MRRQLAQGISALFAVLLATIYSASLAYSSATRPPKSPTTKLYVADTQGDDLAVVDAVNMKLIGYAQVGLNPHGAVASPDGHTLYVTIEGTNELAAVDTSTDKVTRRVRVGRSPNEPTVTTDGRYVFVPLRNDSAVDVVDTRSFTVIDR